MEATVLSVGTSVVSGALSYAKSAVAREVALQLGVQRDQAFITDELEMMQAFLMAAHDERAEGGNNKVVKVWVKQVGDVAYDVEDCLQDFAVRLHQPEQPSCSWWWHFPRVLLERRRVGKQMKDLRAKVQDVSQRNERYRLINGSAAATAATSRSRQFPAVVAGVATTTTTTTMSGIDEARRLWDNAKKDLIELINSKDDEVRVTAVLGSSTSGDLGETSIIKRVYEDLKIRNKFECYAWIRSVISLFNPREYLQSIARQFYVNSLDHEATTEVQRLRWMGTMKENDDFVDQFKRFVNKRSYLIVLSDIRNIENWDRIRMCFPDDRKKVES